MNDELLPCPFCGGPVSLERAHDTLDNIHGTRKWWGVVCRNTLNLGGTCAVQIRPSASPETAIERWNRRAPTQQPSGEVTEEQPSLTNPLTPYGMLVRALRIVTGTTLMDMAQHLGRGPAELSAIEFGRKPVRHADIVDAAHFFACAGIQSTTHALTIGARAGGQHAD